MDEVTAAVVQGMRTWRAARHWTQAELAARLGWSPASVSAAEVGRKGLRIDEVYALAVVFDISVPALLRDAPDHIRQRFTGP